MKKVRILVPETAVIEAIGDPRYAFTMVNEFMVMQGQAPVFDIRLVGAQPEVKLLNGLIAVHPELLLEDAGDADLIFIPALSGNLKEAVARNQAFIPWIVEQHGKGATVASLCLGAFLLADTGLLDGKKCSTHWLSAQEFRATFPQVHLVDGSIITEEQGLYSSGGANSYWNLLLYLIEQYTHRDMAVLAAKFFAIDIDRDSQSAFMIFQGQRDHNDAVVRKAQDHIEANYHDKLSVDQLADLTALGRRSFERRFKKATNNTVVEYIQRVKVEAAKRSFENTLKNISEVMYEVGYTDTKAFRDIFKRITGLSPIEYRNKYHKSERKATQA